MRSIVALLLLVLAAPAAAQTYYGENGGTVVVSTGYGTGDTSIVLQSGHGARLGSNFPQSCLWWDDTTYPGGRDASYNFDPKFEAITVTARSTDTLTVTRSGSPQTHNDVGKTYVINCGVTAATLAQLNAGQFPTIAVDLTTLVTDPSNNRVGVGTASPGQVVDVVTTAADSVRYNLYANATTGPAFALRKGRGTEATPLRAQDGDTLGALSWSSFQAVDNSTTATATANVGQIRLTTTDNFSSTTQGTQLEFRTVADGGTGIGTSATLTSAALSLASAVALNIQNATQSIFHATWGTSAEGIQVTQDAAGLASWTVNGTGTVLGDAGGKFEFDPATGQWRWYADRRGSTFRPHMQLETDIAAGGTDYTDTTLSLFGRSGVGLVSDFFSSQLNLGAIDGTSAATSYGIITDGSWTNGGGFSTNTQFLLWNQIGLANLFRHSQAAPKVIELGDTTADKGATVQVNGRDIITGDANSLVGGLDVDHSVTSANNTDTRTWYGTRLRATLNTTGTTTNKTFSLLDLDTTNTSTTGTTVSLIDAKFGGAARFSVSSAGNTAIAGALTLSGDDQPAQITAATNDYAISATSAVTVVDADQIRAITGMTGGADGRQHTIINDGASDSVIILRAQDTGSTAANRFAMPQDVVLEPSHAATFWYNSTASRWQLLSSTAEDHAQRKYLPFDETDWLGVTGADTLEAHLPWNLALIGTGSAQAKVAGNGVQRGILRCTSGTTANSGCQTTTDLTAFRLSGGEFAEFIVNIDTTTNTTIRLGFLDTTTSTDATDGAYIEIPASTSPTCKTANNSTRTTSAAIATISTATWYRFLIEVDNTAGNVTCSIFNSSGDLLGSQTNSANIPTTAGRETGHGWVATNSGTSATNAIQVDYQAVGTHRAIIR